jgi:hypothetical protein
MQKIVINDRHGGFGLSEEALAVYNLAYNSNTALDYDANIPRNDPVLVRIVETLGERANSRYSRLKVVEIPDDVEWTVCEYDGCEWVAEVHRTWS